MRIQRGGGGWGGGGGGRQGVRTPLNYHKNIGFSSITGPDPLKKIAATKSAFNVGPSSARQQNAIQLRFAGRLMMALLKWYLDPPSPHQLKKKGKKKFVEIGSPLIKLLDPRLTSGSQWIALHGCLRHIYI